MPAPQRHGDDPRSAILSRNFYGPYGKEFAAGEITGDDTPVGLGDGPILGDGSVEIGDAGILNPDAPFAMDPDGSCPFWCKSCCRFQWVQIRIIGERR